MKFKVATTLIALTGALSVTGTASAWSFYVPPSSQQQSASEKKSDSVDRTIVSNYRG